MRYPSDMIIYIIHHIIHLQSDHVYQTQQSLKLIYTNVQMHVAKAMTMPDSFPQDMDSLTLPPLFRELSVFDPRSQLEVSTPVTKQQSDR